jgi:CRISPR-associated endoribonuclease Cas6
VEEHSVIAQHELCTAMFQFPRHLQIGFVGRCRFATPIGDAERLQMLNALADFALYAGVGYKTTMGMGQVRRLRTEPKQDMGAAR